MSLENKYELLYRQQNDVCGDPFPEFVAFAESFPNSSASVLDLGCEQGRDAIVFAGRGMEVTGVDISPTGIDKMVTFAEANGLHITGVVSDIREYNTDSRFNIIVLDRTLHMLPSSNDRVAAIERSAGWLADFGYLLIADERSNIPDFVEWFTSDSRDWKIAPKMKPGFCFVQLANA